jgi:hypothetical protein
MKTPSSITSNPRPASRTKAKRGRRRAARKTRRTAPRHANPQPQQIEAACQAIQATWTSQERQTRGLATSASVQRSLHELANSVLPPPNILGAGRLHDCRRILIKLKTRLRNGEPLFRLQARSADE